jgi:pimeloyl-ACP methyl ester carboxylesterase
MSTFAIAHGAAGCAWEWHLVAAELEAAGHRVVAVDLPCEDEARSFGDYADALVTAAGDAGDVVVAAHSLGGYTGALAASRLGAPLVLCSAMVPRPGESAGEWWTTSGHAESGYRDGDEDEVFLHDVPPALRAAAKAHARDQAGAPLADPFPLDPWPDVPVRAVLFGDDRFFPLPFMRRLHADRLGITDPAVVPGGHCAYLSHPRELAAALATG